MTWFMNIIKKYIYGYKYRYKYIEDLCKVACSLWFWPSVSHSWGTSYCVFGVRLGPLWIYHCVFILVRKKTWKKYLKLFLKPERADRIRFSNHKKNPRPQFTISFQNNSTFANSVSVVTCKENLLTVETLNLFLIHWRIVYCAN